MSTRATILIKEGNEKVHIYHHHDGYPDGVGKDLKNYLKGVKYWDSEDIANDLIKGKVNSDDEYEFTTCQHGDEAYGYLIDCNNHTITCYCLHWDEYDWSRCKIIEIPD